MNLTQYINAASSSIRYYVSENIDIDGNQQIIFDGEIEERVNEKPTISVNINFSRSGNIGIGNLVNCCDNKKVIGHKRYITLMISAAVVMGQRLGSTKIDNKYFEEFCGKVDAFLHRNNSIPFYDFSSGEPVLFGNTMRMKKNSTSGNIFMVPGTYTKVYYVNMPLEHTVLVCRE